MLAPTTVLPTRVLDGQLSAWNAVSEHFALACGLPSRPAGKCSVLLRMLSLVSE